MGNAKDGRFQPPRGAGELRQYTLSELCSSHQRSDLCVHCELIIDQHTKNLGKFLQRVWEPLRIYGLSRSERRMLMRIKLKEGPVIGCLVLVLTMQATLGGEEG